MDFKTLTQCVKLLGERVLQVGWWYLHWFRRYRKKTRGGLEIAPPPSGALVNMECSSKLNWTELSQLQYPIPSAYTDSEQTAASRTRQHHRGLPPSPSGQSSGRLRARLGPAHVPDRSGEPEYDQATGASGAEPGKAEPRRCRWVCNSDVVGEVVTKACQWVFNSGVVGKFVTHSNLTMIWCPDDVMITFYMTGYLIFIIGIISYQLLS